MKKEVRFGDFLVHFSAGDSGISLSFEVYPVIDWSGPNNTSGTSYTSSHDGCMIDIFDEKNKDILKKMEGSYCWRGVWDGRLYFTDDEYWSSDLKELSEVFYTHIEPWCKTYIRQFYPHADA